MEEAEAFLAAVEPEARREEARRLDALFRRTTGWTPVMWSGIVGYGRYAYRYESGREGEWFATGFAPRKGKISVYILPGCADFGPLLARLGRHSTGKACLYIPKLDAVDEDVLAELIRAGLEDLARQWPVEPS